MKRPGLASTVATVLVTAVTVGLPASAPAAKRDRTDEVCAPQALLYESPDGLRIGVVAGGKSVFVIKRSASGKWVRVKTTIGARGWVKAKLLCDEGR